MSDITITYSIYGTFDARRLFTSIISVLNQGNIIPEIIISEENLESKIGEITKQFSIKHIFSKPQINEKGICVYNPGKIRNVAMNNVKTEYVYLNDADIIFLNKNYFKSIINEINGDEALIWPPSRRLIEQDVEEFIEISEKKGINQALRKLKFPNEYLAHLNGKVEPLKEVKHKNGRVYTTEMSTFERYLFDETMKGKEPTFWNDIVHVGGVFTKTQMANSVGNYSQSYITWGYEDVDLQWKLSERYSTRTIPRLLKFEVLHLDHPKNYFSQDHNERNNRIFEKRQLAGVENAINFDLENLR